MDQYRSRLKLSENFERHWSIPISGEIHMDQSLVHTFFWGNLYGPIVLEVLQKFSRALALVHGWLFPVIRGGENGVFGKRSFCWGDTRHFVIFVDFRGPRSKIPCFCGQNAISDFSPIFVKTTCFRQGTKRPFSKTTVSTTLSN